MRFPLNPGPVAPRPGVLLGWNITSMFGGRVNPLTGQAGSWHGGMDLAFGGCAGQPILAPVAGRVSQGWDPSGGGNWTSLFADDGSYWGFGHASSFAPGVNGRRVNEGETLAFVGSTGGSTGAHLHVAYKRTVASPYSDPYDLLLSVAGAPAPPAPVSIPVVVPSPKDTSVEKLIIRDVFGTPFITWGIFRHQITEEGVRVYTFFGVKDLGKVDQAWVDALAVV